MLVFMCSEILRPDNSDGKYRNRNCSGQHQYAFNPTFFTYISVLSGFTAQDKHEAFQSEPLLLFLLEATVQGNRPSPLPLSISASEVPAFRSDYTVG
jgi:hypothetical protein